MAPFPSAAHHAAMLIKGTAPMAWSKEILGPSIPFSHWNQPTYYSLGNLVRIKSLSGVSNVFVAEIFLHLRFVFFTTSHKSFDILPHLFLINWPFLANDVCS